MRNALHTYRLYRRAGLPLGLSLRRAAADLPGLSRIAAAMQRARSSKQLPELL